MKIAIISLVRAVRPRFLPAIIVMLFLFTIAEPMAQAAGSPAPPQSAAQIWPTVSQAEVEARYPEEWKAQRRAEAAIAANAWGLTRPHVQATMPWLVRGSAVPA